MPRARSPGTAKSTRAGGTASSSGKSPILALTDPTWSEQRRTQSTSTTQSQKKDPSGKLPARSKQSGTLSTPQPGTKTKDVLNLFSVLAATEAHESVSHRTTSQQPGSLSTAKSDSSVESDHSPHRRSEDAREEGMTPYEDADEEYDHIRSDGEATSDEEA